MSQTVCHFFMRQLNFKFVLGYYHCEEINRVFMVFENVELGCRTSTPYASDKECSVQVNMILQISLRVNLRSVEVKF